MLLGMDIRQNMFEKRTVGLNMIHLDFFVLKIDNVWDALLRHS